LNLKIKLFNFIYIYKLMKQITIIGPAIMRVKILMNI